MSLSDEPTVYEFSPGAFMEMVYPCSNARYCGNRATTERFSRTVSDYVRMCESCAAEYDEVFTHRTQ